MFILCILFIVVPTFWDFILKTCRQRKYNTKINIMAYMASFDDNVASLRPQITVVTSAARNLRNNSKVKKILEIILAFGNYMNSSKKGPCYGFKLSSLDSLTISKSGTDKTRNLLHYIVDLVNEKYPSLKDFYNELSYLKVTMRGAVDLKVITVASNGL